MYSLNVAMYRKPGNEANSSAIDGILEYGSKNLTKIESATVDEMNNQIKNLENSLGELRAKVKAYHDIILKYESVFREEILLYRLQKTKLTTMQQALHNQELCTKEIEQHVTSYLNDKSQKNNHYSAFKRIVLRFFNQNKHNQSNTTLKISEIEELINKKQQLLDKFQSEIKNCNKKLPLAISASDSQQLVLN